MKNIKITGFILLLLFGVLISIRLGIVERFLPSLSDHRGLTGKVLSEKDTWMNVFQDNRKIGYSHSEIKKTEDNYLLSEDLFMRINTMGFAQDLKLMLKGTLAPDLSLEGFDVSLSSGLLTFNAKGSVSEKLISIDTDMGGKKSQVDIPITEKPYLTAGIIQAFSDDLPEPGETYTYSIFDPTAMATIPIQVKVVAEEEIEVMGEIRPSTKIAVVFKGMTQYSWIGKNGDLLKETGMLGLHLERTTKEEALNGLPIQASDDLTKAASVVSNVVFDYPDELEMLKVRISGVNLKNMSLEGGRQTLERNVLTIQKERIKDFLIDGSESKVVDAEKQFLTPTTFIQSDHPDIVKTVETIVAQGDIPLEKVKKIVAWVEKNIKKQPVLSLPDALSTLKNRVGDCNEHAVLTAALLRAAGIPARVEAGLVYMNGRFYYHAWNRFYVGKWITADSVFGQVPADVTHIRFGIGAQEAQLDILNLIDKVKIEVLDD